MLQHQCEKGEEREGSVTAHKMEVVTLYNIVRKGTFPWNCCISWKQVAQRKRITPGHEYQEMGTLGVTLEAAIDMDKIEFYIKMLILLYKLLNQE